MALALLLITVDSLGVAAAELAFDIKIERGRVADPMRLIRVNEGDAIPLGTEVRLTGDFELTERF